MMKIDKDFLEDIYQDSLAIRRQLHSHPDLSGQEFRTKKYIDGLLLDMGVDLIDLGMEKASLGLIEGGRPGPCLAIRADTDALPIVEETGLAFAAKNGAMHACGHDLHMAILLGTAKYLMAHRQDLAGMVKLLFQPDEEKNGGAEDMVKAGAMEGVDLVVGLHVDPAYPTGTLTLKKGFLNASVDDFTIMVKGRGGHGAHPHLADDTILAAAHIITGIQSLISRRKSPLDPGLISIGSIHGGNKENILPSQVEIKGTLRAATEEIRQDLLRDLDFISSQIARSMHMETEFEIREGYIPLINDPGACQEIWEACRPYFGEDHLVWLDQGSMGADDFAYFLKEAPGAYYNIGVRGPGQEAQSLHTGTFNPDERAIYYGILSQLAIVQKFLG